ncbi:MULTISPECIES: carbohydrate ABC transporter permease [unclassified Paenibacillus]|uniref:Carbohydrate ABC transporter permease n=1 Tax=Paenibacillus provencensis TaxID=441151 RepID=A0ABW3PQJ1_9BACL|nr:MULTISPECIES: carbohydrate ABC transporter permease [unclassified Paenibacillus]MCM3127010.1 carbohydrate ABC transporter permease [Paenibacillus sp. MER 78]SFS56706.1 multiple sugar transport system permease protein [Paenibacillus sp. 453mf]
MANLSTTEKAVSYIFLILVGVLLASPFMYMISIALASESTTVQSAFTFIPREFQVSNFLTIFTNNNLGTYLKNSIIITFFTIIGSVLSASVVSYGFARIKAKGSRLLFIVLLSTMMIPGEVTMVPQFIIFRHLDWINTFYPLIVPSFFAGAFNVFLIRQFIMSIPKSLDEAAMIDGMGHPGIYFRIIMPLTYPILTAIAIFSFSWNWGNFMGPLIYINDPEKMPLALGVQLLTTVGGGQMPPWNLVMVASLFLTMPMVLVYLFGQRYVYEANITGGSSGIK